MTAASEVPPAEQPAPRAVVYLYSQTGQLREVADALTAPLVDRGWDIRWVDVQPRTAFPFPWPIRRFFGVFPAAVDPDALVELVEPVGGFETEPDELVILAYQVWYLAPSLPIRSLLKAHPEAFRNRRVVSLIACRNMWYSAAIEMRGLLRSAGARSVEVVAATDTQPQAISLVTTLRWLLTGRREPFLWFARAGIGASELARVADVGRRIAESGQYPHDAAPIVPTLAAADLLAGKVFRRWGATVRSARRFGAVAQAASLTIFVVGLGIAIAVGLPLIAMRGTRRRCAVRHGGVVLSCVAGSRTTGRAIDSGGGREALMTADASEYQELVDWLTMKVAGYLHVAPDTIDIDTPLADCGIDSVLGMTLCADLECEKGFAVETTIVWDYPTIDAIAAHLVAERAAP